MTEYVIFIVMVVFATGFASLWLIEQRKRRTKEASEKRSPLEKGD